SDTLARPMNRTRKLWLVFEGGPVTGRPVRAHLEAPPRGPWLRVTVGEEGLSSGVVYLLMRRGLGDLIVGASAHRAPLETAMQRLGEKNYEIVDVPVSR